MTEQEYIKVDALATITSAIGTLRNLVPEQIINLQDVITEKDFSNVMASLTNWQKKLYKQIKIDTNY